MIEEWGVITQGNLRVIEGFCFNHPNFEDDTEFHTSCIKEGTEIVGITRDEVRPWLNGHKLKNGSYHPRYYRVICTSRTYILCKSQCWFQTPEK